MPRTDWGWLIEPGELDDWTLYDSPELLVIDKPAHVVCHPSKHGPWSSLVGACREKLGLPRVYLPSRLDRETSGVVVIAKDRKTASHWQRAMEHRRVRKSYLAVLTGELTEERDVEAPIGRDVYPSFSSRQRVDPEAGRAARTVFTPLRTNYGRTLARVAPHTGRLHQIRVHAAHIGFPIVGDKLYGPDPSLLLQFIRDGFTEELREQLILDRHALHAEELGLGDLTFRAPFPDPLRQLLD